MRLPGLHLVVHHCTALRTSQQLRQTQLLQYSHDQLKNYTTLFHDFFKFSKYYFATVSNVSVYFVKINGATTKPIRQLVISRKKLNFYVNNFKMASIVVDEQPSSMIDQEDDSGSNSENSKESSTSAEESAPTLGTEIKFNHVHSCLFFRSRNSVFFAPQKNCQIAKL